MSKIKELEARCVAADAAIHAAESARDDAYDAYDAAYSALKKRLDYEIQCVNEKLRAFGH